MTTKVGQRVTIKGKEEEYGEGTVRFVGIVKFDAGKWVGIELDKPMGKHDGVVKGERYFQTKPNHAVFTKYGQTTPASTSAAPAGAKKVSAPSASAAASNKKVTAKPTTGITSKPPSNPASSVVSSASTSAAPTPPNELEDGLGPVSEVLSAESDVISEPLVMTTPPPDEAVESPAQTLSPSPSSSSLLISPVASPEPVKDVVEDLRPLSPVKAAPAAAPTLENVRSPSPVPKPTPTASPAKATGIGSKTTTAKAPSWPMKAEPKPKKVEPVASSSNAVDSTDLDDGESAYESELRMRDLQNLVDTLQEERDVLKQVNARLENQISILKEGSEAFLAQQQVGGAAREAVEAELKTQIRDLRVKLEATSERCSDAEKRARDLEQQVALSAKSQSEAIAVAVQKATSELTAAFNKLKAETDDKLEALATDLEMVTMDKEIAEEERDATTKDYEQLKMQHELLQSTLAQKADETARRDSLGPSSSLASADDITTSPEYAALSTQHEHLKEVLVRLKELAVAEQQEKEKALRELEQVTMRTLPALEDKVLKLSEQNIDYEEQIEILKANIDDASELQDKYTDLFEKKLDIEEENKKLKLAVKELEDIRDVAEELEAEQRAAEERLKQELYTKQVEILNGEAALKNATIEIETQRLMADRLQGLLAEQRAHSAETEKRLQSALKSRRRRHRRRQPIDLDDGEFIPSEDDEEMVDDEELSDDFDEENDEGGALAPSSSSRSLQQKESEIQVMLQKQAAKAASQALVDKLRDLERAQAIEQFALFQAFVPETYIRADSEAIKCLLLNKRLMEKATIIVQYLQEQYHLEKFERSAVVQEDASSLHPLTTTEELSYFAWRLASLITRLGNNAAIMVDNFKIAENDTYLRFARLLSELSPCEKKLDHLITLLQQESLTVAYSVQDFEVLLESFDSVVAQYCQLTALPASQHYMRLGYELVFAARACFFEVVALRTALNQISQTLNAPVLTSALDLVSQTIVKYLVDGSRKLRRAAEGRPALTYVGTTLSSLKGAVRLVSTILRFFSTLRHRVVSDSERLEEGMLLELQESAMAQCMPEIEAALAALPPSDETAGKLTKALDGAVTRALKFLFVLDEAIARGVHDDTNPSSSTHVAGPVGVSAGSPSPVTLPAEDRVIQGVAVAHVAQLNARAAVLLEEVAAAAGLKGELASLQRELRDRDTTLGYKAKEIEDLEFRLKKQEHRLAALERVESEAKEELASHQKNYASQVLNLETANRELADQVELVTTEREEAKGDAQKQLARVAALEQQLAATIQKQQQSMSLDSATTQISSLKAAVRHLSGQLLRLRAKESKELLSQRLPPLIMPAQRNTASHEVIATKDSTLREQAADIPVAGTELSTTVSKATAAFSPLVPNSSGFSQEMAKLIDTAYTLTTTPTVVDLTRTDQSPANQLESLHFESLRVKAALMQASRNTVQTLALTKNKLASSHFSSFPNTSFVASVNATARGPIKMGTFTMPSPLPTTSMGIPLSTPRTVQVTPADLCSIHSMLVK
jgi:dynactin 1